MYEICTLVNGEHVPGLTKVTTAHEVVVVVDVLADVLVDVVVVDVLVDVLVDVMVDDSVVGWR